MESPETRLPEILAKKLPTLHDLCHKHHVKYLWVFGSVLTDEFRECSDIDFLYEWDRPAIPEGQYLANQDGFITALQVLFGRKIDLIHYPSLRNPYFIREIEATKTLLYAQRSEKISV